MTLGSSIERPATLDTCSIMMADVAPPTVVAGVLFAVARGASPELIADYAVANTGERVVTFILFTAGQHRFWAGLR